MTFANFDKSAADLIRTDRRGRLLVRAQQREAIVDAFEASSLSGMAFCRKHQLSYSTFATWVQKRRKDRKAGRTEIRPEPKPKFAEVLVEANEASNRPPEPLRVCLQGAVTVEISSSSQLPLLVELLRSLDSQSLC